MQRNLHTWSETRDHPPFVQRNNLHAWIRIIFWKKSAAWSKSVVSIRNCQADALNAHFQHVARLCVFNVNRTGKDVSAWAFVADLFGDLAQRLLNLFGRHAS